MIGAVYSIGQDSLRSSLALGGEPTGDAYVLDHPGRCAMCDLKTCLSLRACLWMRMEELCKREAKVRCKVLARICVDYSISSRACKEDGGNIIV